jgi:hypothetical protein
MMNLMHHDAEILDQFTKQAEPFLQRHENSHEDLLQLMLNAPAFDGKTPYSISPADLGLFLAISLAMPPMSLAWILSPLCWNGPGGSRLKDI